VLILEKSEEGFYSEDHLKVLELVSDQITMSLANATFTMERKRVTDQLSVLAEISKMAAKLPPISSLEKKVVDLISSKMGFDRVFLISVDYENKVFYTTAVSSDKIKMKEGYTQDYNKGILGWVRKNQKSLIVNDVEKDKRYVAFIPDTKSELGIPILVGNEVNRIINIESTSKNAFSFQDQLSLETIAREIASLLTHLEQAQIGEKRSKQLSMINEIVRETSTTLDEEALLEKTASMIQEQFYYFDVMIFLLDTNRKNLILRAHSGGYTDFIYKGLRIQYGKGLVGHCASGKKSVVVDDVLEDSRFISMEGQVTRSELCCPIVIEGEIEGVLNVESEKPKAFDEWDIKAMESLASHIGNVLENSRRLNREKRRSTVFKVVGELDNAISRKLEFREVLEEFVSNFQTQQRYLDVAVFIIDENADEFVKTAQSGAYKGHSPPDYRQSVGVGLFGAVYKTKKTVLINDVSKDKRFHKAPWVKTRSELITPIIHGKKLLGIINVESQDLNAFDEWDKMIIESVSSHLATAMENARLYEEEKKRSHQLSIIHDISKNLMSELDVDVIVDKAARKIHSEFGVDNFGIFLKERHVKGVPLLVVKANAGIYEELAVVGSEFPGDEGLIGRAFQKGETVVINDTSKDKYFVPEPYNLTKAEICVPLLDGSEVIGVVNVENTTPNSFDNWAVIVMEAITEVISRAIQNARILQNEKKRAQQFSLIADFGKEIMGILSIEGLYEITSNTLKDKFGFLYVEAYEYEEDTDDVVLVSGSMKSDKKIKPGMRSSGSIGIIGQAMKTGSPQTITTTSSSKLVKELENAGILSMMACPIYIGKNIGGMIRIGSDQVDAFSEWDMMAVEGVAGHLGRAIEKAQKYREEERTRKQMMLLNEIGLEISSLTSPQEIINMAVKLIHKKFRYFEVEIFIVEEDGIHLKAYSGGLKKLLTEPVKLETDEGVVGWVVKKGKTALVHDSTVDERFVAKVGQTTRSELCVPIIIEGKIVGAINLESKQFDSFDDWDILAMETVANQIATSLQRCGEKSSD
jgi:putative methionine-R-sulfoxide reductase with GAF domain